jgi:hypothetical protein
MNDDDLNPEKVQRVLSDAWAALDPAERAERIAWDIAHGVPGVTSHPDPADDLIEFIRGGRTLALVQRAVLCGDGPLEATREHFDDDIPDHPPDDL